MYAIIETGGKQYRVREGDVLDVERLEAGENEEVEFDRVLAWSGEDDFRVGTPYLEDISVKGRVLEHGKGEKLIVFKFKPKTGYRRKQGHRQPYTRIEIEAIVS